MRIITFLGLLVLENLLCECSEHHELLDKRLMYYEPVHYDQDHLHHQHKHAATSGNILKLKFNAFNRKFSLELKRVSTSSNFILHHKKKSTSTDLSFVYTGKDTDYLGSEVRVAVINGTFQGKIKHQGETTYHIVPSSWLFKQLPPFHTVIYSEKDYNWTHTFPADTVQHGKDSQVYKEPRVRTKRDLPTSNTALKGHVCSLKLTTDSTVWKYFMNLNQNEDRSRYDILFMLVNHVAEANVVFGNTEFTLNEGQDNEKKEKGIQFEIRRIEIWTDLDCDDSNEKNRSELCDETLDGITVLDKFADEEELKINNYDYGEQKHSNYYDNNYDNEGHYDNASQEFYYDYDEYFGDSAESPEFCLSFLVTARVLYHSTGNPLLGYAFRSQKGKAGGICANSGNNGFITLFQDTDQALPALVTQLVFTHEVAHAFGAVHDNMQECLAFNLKQEPDDGYYLMHAVAQRGNKPNNQKLSDCSIQFISEALSRDDVQCFTGTELPYCGNGVVDVGEECDCGTDCHIDHCCHAHNATGGLKCKLKAGAQCSPSQGPCCSSSVCQFINQSENFVCQNTRPCVDKLYCHGEIYGAQCPPPRQDEVRVDGFICSPNGRVCDVGSCNASICKLIQWRECQLSSSKQKLSIPEKERLCYIGCQMRKSTECVSTDDLDKVSQYPEFLSLLKNVSDDSALLRIQLPIGTPCNKNTGYCDVFRRCRGADPDTPLARLKNCLANSECPLAFFQEYWWGVLLGGIAGIILLLLFVKCCAVHTKSSNPVLERLHPRRSVRQSVTSVYDTMSHPRRSMRNSVRSMRDSFRHSLPISNEWNLKKIEAELEVLNENPKTNVDDVFL